MQGQERQPHLYITGLDCHGIDVLTFFIHNYTFDLIMICVIPSFLSPPILIIHIMFKVADGTRFQVTEDGKERLVKPIGVQDAVDEILKTKSSQGRVLLR